MTALRASVVLVSLVFCLASGSKQAPPPQQQPQQQWQAPPQQQSPGGFGAPTGGGQYFCHRVTTQSGARVTLCKRSFQECDTWRGNNANSGFGTDSCTPQAQAACYNTTGGNYLCFGSMEECQVFYESDNDRQSACTF